MGSGTLGTWNVKAVIIARTFLAATLLLGASVEASQPGFDGELGFSFGLLLGVVIAAGWLIRYAAALVVLATVTTGVLAPHFHLALLPAHTGTAAAVLIASGILICFGQNTNKAPIASNDENNPSARGASFTLDHRPWNENPAVAIRFRRPLS